MDGVKVGTDIDERPAKRFKLEEPTKVVNPWTPFRREDLRIRETSWTSHESSPSHLLSPVDPQSTALDAALDTTPGDADQDVLEAKEEAHCPQIFAHLCFYVNGSTAPLISDHKLKRLLSSHGGNLSIALGRRTVTHVVIGRPSSNGGCGGGLAGSKIQKEVTRVGGNSVKYVTAEWVVESVKAGKRLPESRFEALRLAPKGMNSVADTFRTRKQGEKPITQKDDAG